MKNKTDEFPRTVEDLGIEYGLHVMESAELICTVEYEAADPGDYITPPSGGVAWITDFKVESVTFSWDEGARLITGITIPCVLKAARKHVEETNWMEDQEEWATRVWNERAGAEHEAAEEAYWDSRDDHERCEL